LDEFIAQLTASQTSLYAYILSLLPDRTAAEDVLQETNMTLWRKAETFEPGTDFMAWACTVAYHKVLNHRSKRARDRHLFSEALLEKLGERLHERAAELDDRRRLLRRCLKRLSKKHRQLIESRYEPGASVGALAERLGRPVGSISQTLYRVRGALADCIRRGLTPERAS